MPRWIKYVGPSPSRDIPGVGEMVQGEAVQVSDAVAERLLGSPVFAEAAAGSAAKTEPEPAGEGEG